MRRLTVIGIGTGHPDHLTLQGVKALGRAAAVFVLDKGEDAGDLVTLRRELCARHGRPDLRIVTAQDPPRDRDPADYRAAVEAWHAARATLVADLVRTHLGPEETGAILVWGDPALYDSTLRILERVLAHDPDAFAYAVIPGISTPQMLAAAHRIPLNRIGAPVHITTGRRLADGLPEGPGTTIVMLDANPTFDHLDPELTIHWGAYLGSEHQILVAGRLGSVAHQIQALRAQARTRHGWIMDTYMLTKPEGA